MSKINPEIRVVIALIIGVTTIFLQSFISYLIMIFTITILGVFMKTKFKSLLKRMTYILPLVIMLSIFIPITAGQVPLYSFPFLFWQVTIYRDGIVIAINFATRMLSIFYFFMFFLSSLTFTEFTSLRIFPNIISGSLLIMINFIPVFMLQEQKLIESQQLRGKKLSSHRDKIRAAGNIIGTTLIKAQEQSERTFESMRLRGFGGKIKFKTSKIRKIDIFWLSITILFVVLILLIFEFYWRIDLWKIIGLSV
ncbi:MAG: energy-coupling factor transporter transmembrane component T family protein [Candidatus Helarchaeota archaeon]